MPLQSCNRKERMKSSNKLRKSLVWRSRFSAFPIAPLPWFCSLLSTGTPYMIHESCGDKIFEHTLDSDIYCCVCSSNASSGFTILNGRSYSHMELTVRAVQLAELQRSRANSNTASMSSMSKSAEENKRLKEALAQRQIRDAEIKRRLGETGT